METVGMVGIVVFWVVWMVGEIHLDSALQIVVWGASNFVLPETKMKRERQFNRLATRAIHNPRPPTVVSAGEAFCLIIQFIPLTFSEDQIAFI